MKEDSILVMMPEWLKDIEDDDVAGAIFAMIFSWQWDNEDGIHIDNLREYIASRFDDLTDSQVSQVADLLIKHGVVKSDQVK